MASGIYELVEGSLFQQARFDTISNNLANINTTAFKKDVISFNEMSATQYASDTDFTPGPLRYTGNRFDVALGKKGFFKIQTARGVRYTRDGAFTLNAERVMVTRNGDPVLGVNGPINVDGDNVSMTTEGQVLVNGNPVDKILVVDFNDPQLLLKEGGSYYEYRGEEKDIFTSEELNVKQGYIEGSNVSPTEEMIKMVEAFRAFESTQKAIQAMDECTSKLVNDSGLL